MGLGANLTLEPFRNDRIGFRSFWVFGFTDSGF